VGSPDASASFESLAGPVDRMATALNAVQALLGQAVGSDVFSGLDEASAALRRLYFRLVGLVLDEIDSRCVGEWATAVERREKWDDLNRFVDAVLRADHGGPAALFTLNYDSLLDSAMMETAQRFYDGYPGLTLDVRLDARGLPALYHLHGSVAWITRPDGVVVKRRLDYLRAIGHLAAWIGGEPTTELPTVVLSDLKTPSTARHPFSLFYDELQRALGRVKTVVAGGVSFGDLPINRLIAAYLAEDVERRLVVWRPSGTGADEVFTMLKQLPGGNRAKRAQVLAQRVSLPDAAAVDALD
jgi:hypothetical protein